MATRLPASTQQVVEPLLQSIPLTELRPLLKDETLRQYSNAYLPERVARLQTYDRLPPVEALTLAVQEGDLDIADEITNAERDSFSFFDTSGDESGIRSESCTRRLRHRCGSEWANWRWRDPSNYQPAR